MILPPHFEKSGNFCLKHTSTCTHYTVHNVKSFHIVVLGWMISLSVEPGIEPGIFRFQSKVLATPLPSLHSSFTFLLLFLTLLFSLSLCLSLSLCASSFVPLPPSFLLLLLAEKNSRQKKRVGFYSHHSTHNSFP